MIDSVIVFAALLIVRIILGLASIVFSEVYSAGSSFFQRGLLFNFTLKDILLYLVKVSYFVVLTYYTGCTLGKRAMNLVVVSQKTPDGRLGLLDIIYRETIGRYLSGFLLGLGYIMIGIGKEKCGLHDILCDTRVIYNRKINAFHGEYLQHLPNSNPFKSPWAAAPGSEPLSGKPPEAVPPCTNSRTVPNGPYSYVPHPEKNGIDFENNTVNRPNQPNNASVLYQYGGNSQNASYQQNTADKKDAQTQTDTNTNFPNDSDPNTETE